jgi:hypothetical protein
MKQPFAIDLRVIVPLRRSNRQARRMIVLEKVPGLRVESWIDA